MKDIRHYLPGLAAATVGLLSVGIVWGVPRQQFWLYWGLFSLAFLAYWLLLQYPKNLCASPKVWLGLALLFRVALLPAFPNLSDDIYRFAWDGTLLNEGLHPFSQVPSEFPSAALSDFQQELRAKMNSPDYFTIYPPLAQATFASATYLGGGHLGWVAFWMKLGVFLAEAGTLLLLFQYFRSRSGGQQWALYAFNPLVLVELCGNLHFEAYMVFFTVLALVSYEKGKPWAVGMALAGGVAAKLLPLIFLPGLLRAMPIRGWLVAGLSCFLAMGLVFAPLYDPDLLVGMGQSFSLYFETFEFNASIYYLLRAWGYWTFGYNLIGFVGPYLSLAVFLLVMVVALARPVATTKKLAGVWLWSLTIYLALATIVHPWYLTPLVALGTFARWRFVLVWSWLVGLSYSAYQDASYTENYWLVGVEYGVVLVVLLVEWLYRRRKAAC